ncbi:hypothetical protein [Flavilitoribacter nigricans]|uniref:Uncharacterized protein n=1 Tax=Flavilitoribacter nigricans (strain ATCC 23147 / DSM 23189 / NBRC 102662 / NCIMB 1420 / SS-2) TaxID=1122177 RepID=A0A2D0N9X3_FLAN2|nr:hypothetical protein [Flavilitoribacter nigricans]PHN05321.1 hypothetical protein CRP01_17550 [Flavilitoribacter nigricans DSM 23189 = NBRC 102662]
MKFHEAKVFQLLRLLKAKPFRNFGKWLQSDWCNTNQRLIRVYDLLKKYHPDYDQAGLDKKGLFQKVYPNKPYNDKVLRNLMGELSNQVRAFLINCQLQQDQNLQAQLLISAFAEKGRYGWMEEESERLANRIKKEKVIHRADFLVLTKLYEQLYYQVGTTYRQTQDGSPLQEAEAWLDQYYLLGKLRLANEKRERQLRLQRSAPESIGLDLLDELARHYPNAAVKLYRQRLEQQIMGDLVQFETFHLQFLTVQDQLETRDRKILFYALLNDASRLLKTGNNDVLTALFGLYKFGVEKGILIHKKQITEHTFLNMISIGNSLKEFDYVAEFRKKYSSYLADDFRVDAEKFANAHTDYYQGQYFACMRTLKDHVFSSRLLVNRSRMLLLQAHFEFFLDDSSFFETFHHYALAFEEYVRNDKRLAKTEIKAFRRFSRYARQLAQISTYKHREGALKKLADALEREPYMQGKFWLLEKIRQIKKGHPDTGNPI